MMSVERKVPDEIPWPAVYALREVYFKCFPDDIGRDKLTREVAREMLAAALPDLERPLRDDCEQLARERDARYIEVEMLEARLAERSFPPDEIEALLTTISPRLRMARAAGFITLTDGARIDHLGAAESRLEKMRDE